MHVAVCRLTLYFPDNRSLKGKRQVMRSLTDRVKARFNVSIAEVADQDLWSHGVIGICAVSGDAQYARGMMDRVLDYAEGILFEAQVTDVECEVLDLN
ncbi:MAG: DUF503 domain-containing protein [Chloroflexota bacterium]